MKLGKRKCKNCGKVFQKKQPLQFVCEPLCAIAYGKKQQAKKDKVVRKEMKEGLLTRTDYEKKLTDLCQHIARLIDKGLGCIGCLNKGKMAGGHFHAKGSNNSLRFHLDNIHRQDFHCNGNGGQLLKYGRGLIDEYGRIYKEFVEYDLVKLYPVIKLSIEDLKEKIKIARSIVKHLQLEDKKYDKTERLELRNKYNNMLGIYD